MININYITISRDPESISWYRLDTPINGDLTVTGDPNRLLKFSDKTRPSVQFAPGPKNWKPVSFEEFAEPPR